MKECEFLKRIVKQAEEISNKKFEVKAKGAESDLVTNLDVEIEEFLILKIKEEYPKFDIVSEEENSQNKLTKNCFVIDPIDGTVNFANGVPLWGIQVACVKNGKTIASVIDLPKINEFYWADETGAYLNDKKIHVSVVPIKNAVYAIDGSNNALPIRNMKKYSPSSRNFGAVCVSHAFVAAGRIHGAVFRSEKPWDYLPGLFLCKQAGAAVCDKSGFHASAMNEEFLEILESETAKKSNQSNIFILHSLNGDTLETWAPDIKQVFSDKGIDVFAPEFPIRAESSYEKFREILKFYFDNGTLNKNSIVVAHSIGNPYFIRFSKEFGFVPKNYIAVAPGACYDYPIKRTDYIVAVSKQAYPKPEDFKYAKENFKNSYCLFSDEEGKSRELYFDRFVGDTGAKGMYLEGYGHFTKRTYKIPELNKLIEKLLVLK